MTLLAVEHISKGFGGVHAIEDLSFSIRPATVHSIIGPNGAGKTTLLNMMTGIFVPDSGQIRLAGQDLTGQPTHRLLTLAQGSTLAVALLCLAGFAAAAPGAWFKFILVTRAGFNQGFALVHLPVRGVAR